MSACQPLTSHRYDCHHQLEDAVDEGEGKHDFQFSRVEGQLDNGAAQLGVLETRLQCDGSTSEKSRNHKQPHESVECVSVLFVFMDEVVVYEVF